MERGVVIRSKRKRARVARREQRDRDRQARGFLWRVDRALSAERGTPAGAVHFVAIDWPAVKS